MPNELNDIPLHNTRADSMWKIVSDNVDFTEKSVLDIGCGGGDMMWRAYKAGARIVFGFDKDKRVVWETGKRLDEHGYSGHPIHLHYADMDNWNERWPGEHDIVICFSVLPYLKDPIKVLEGMKRDSEIALIECQYEGDGPGFKGLKNDEDMSLFLVGCYMPESIEGKWSGFKIVEKLGETEIVDREKARSIWLCR